MTAQATHQTAESLNTLRLPEPMQQRLREEVARELEPCREAGGYRTDSRVLLARARR